jgi:hypothetical protein
VSAEVPLGVSGGHPSLRDKIRAFAPRSERGRRRGATAVLQVTCLLAGVAGLVVYVSTLPAGGVDPRSPVGVGFGIAASVAIAAVMIYSVRRSMPFVRRFGPVRPYLDLHIYGGWLFLGFVLFHTNFSLPSGGFLTTLWAVTLWVIMTGAMGTALQRWLPKILDDSSTLEVPFQRIPQFVDELRTRAETMVANSSTRVRAFYEREMAREMTGPKSVLRLQSGRTVAHTFRSHEFEVLRQTVDQEGAETLDQLREMHRAKLEIDLQHTLQSWLRGWLYVHLPVAIVLLGLVVLHVFVVMYF